MATEFQVAFAVVAVAFAAAAVWFILRGANVGGEERFEFPSNYRFDGFMNGLIGGILAGFVAAGCIAVALFWWWLHN